MRCKVAFLTSSALGRVSCVAAIALSLGACSSDVARFTDNPFSNPFSRTGGASSVDRNATGSINRAQSQVQGAAQAVPSAGRVTSAPLAAPVAAAAAPAMASAPAIPQAAAPAAAMTTGSIGRTVGAWTTTGGSPVQVGAGENVNTLASRYGVPAQALLATNGLSSASQVQPGQRLIIPVYNAGPRSAESAPAPQPAPAPVAAAPAPAPARVAPPQPVAPAPQPPVQRQTPVVQAAPPPKPQQVAAPKPVASAAADAAREKARAQAEAARARAEALKSQNAAGARADADAQAKRAAEAKARAEAEKARLAELRARTDADKAKAAEARKAAEAERLKAAEAKRLAEAERKKQADARAQAEREARDARTQATASERAARQQAAAPAAATSSQARTPAAPQTPDPTPTASVPKEAPQADFRWPARGRVINGFTGRGGNEGINIAVPEGTPVKAAGDGVVAYAGNELKGYGNLVLIRHENGYVSAYAHNGDINVKRGDRVGRGQVIARSGQTGNVASPQLHFEIRKGANPVDPMPYLQN